MCYKLVNILQNIQDAFYALSRCQCAAFTVDFNSKKVPTKINATQGPCSLRICVLVWTTCLDSGATAQCELY